MDPSNPLMVKEEMEAQKVRLSTDALEAVADEEGAGLLPPAQIHLSRAGSEAELPVLHLEGRTAGCSAGGERGEG